MSDVGSPWDNLAIRRNAQFPQPSHQALLRLVALDPVAVSAQQLQVLDIVLAAGSLRNDMIDLEDAKGKIGAATVAPALLLAEENLFVLAVRNWLGDVGAPGEQPVMQPVTRRLPGGPYQLEQGLLRSALVRS